MKRHTQELRAEMGVAEEGQPSAETGRARRIPGFCIERELIDEARPVVELLRKCGISLVTAESCTAGLIAAVLSHIPGIGECFHGAFVTYSKQHKTFALGVDATLLNERGSVNAETALQMGTGALKRSTAQIAVAVTGVLGPDPDEDGNPPGLLYVAICHAHLPARVQRFHFQGTPDSVRRRAVREALWMLKEAASDAIAVPRPSDTK